MRRVPLLARLTPIRLKHLRQTVSKSSKTKSYRWSSRQVSRHRAEALLDRLCATRAGSSGWRSSAAPMPSSRPPGSRAGSALASGAPGDPPDRLRADGAVRRGGGVAPPLFSRGLSSTGTGLLERPDRLGAPIRQFLPRVGPTARIGLGLDFGDERGELLRGAPKYVRNESRSRVAMTIGQSRFKFGRAKIYRRCRTQPNRWNSRSESTMPQVTLSENQLAVANRAGLEFRDPIALRSCSATSRRAIPLFDPRSAARAPEVAR